LHVDVGAESRVVGEVPAVMVGIFVDHDLVAVPEPVTAQGKIKGGDAESEAAKPEAVGTASANAPYMAAAEATGESAMFPGMIEVEAGIVSPGIVPDPFSVVVDVRSFWVAFAVAIGLGRGSGRCATNGRRPCLGMYPPPAAWPPPPWLPWLSCCANAGGERIIDTETRVRDNTRSLGSDLKVQPPRDTLPPVDLK